MGVAIAGGGGRNFWNLGWFAKAIQVNMREADRELMARFRAGDSEAFTLVYRTHSPPVFRFALHMTGDQIKAAGITQDVFVWLIHHPEKFDASRGDLSAFLIGVARKFLLRQRRSERQWEPLREAGEAMSAAAVEAFAEPTRDESETLCLREAIAALPEHYRDVVTLCDLEGNTYEAAALALECAVGTVRSRLHRARELLARKLKLRKENDRCAV